jgi:hypothetical protein
MKKWLILSLFITSLMGQQVDYNTQLKNAPIVQLSATCDGSTNDQVKIQAALTSLGTSGGTLVFPPNRVCSVAGIGGNAGGGYENYILRLNSTSSNPVKLDFNGSTLKSTEVNSGNGVILLYLKGSGNVTVVNGVIDQTHSVTGGTTAGIQTGEYAGTSLFGNLLFRDLTIINSSRGLAIGGANNVLVDNVKYYSTQGRAAIINTSEPNVGLWIGQNFSTSPVNSIEIKSGFYSGCGSPNAPTTCTLSGSYASDGYIFGQANKWNIHHNTILRFSYEGIQLLPLPCQLSGSNSCTNQRSLIDSNIIDASPVGSLVGNYAIRCDLGFTSIINNQINGATVGIINFAYYNPSYTGAVAYGQVIKNNSINMYTGSTSVTGQYIGIVTAGADQFIIEDNTIHWQSYSKCDTANNPFVRGVSAGGAIVSGHIRRNTVETEGLSGNSCYIFGVWLQQATGYVQVEGNNGYLLDYGMHFGNPGNSSDPETVTVYSYNDLSVTTDIDPGTGGRYADYSQTIFKTQSLSFTASVGNTGWYRILTCTTFCGGKLQITAPQDNNINTNQVIYFTGAGYNSKQNITLLNAGQYGGPGVVSKARLSNNNDAYPYLDVYIIVSSTPKAIKFTLTDTVYPGITLNVPSYNPSVGSSSYELDFSTVMGIGTINQVGAGYFYSLGKTPTCADGTGAGTTPGTPCAITGTDSYFKVVVVTGTVATTGVITTITLGGVGPPNAMYPVCVPGNAQTSNGAIWGYWYVGANSSTSFTLNSTSNLTSTQTYVWNCSTGGN